MDIREELITEVLNAINDKTNTTDEELQSIKNSLYVIVNKYEVQNRCTALSTTHKSPQQLLNKFIATKRIEGKSESTLKRYYDENNKMIQFLNKDLNDITTFDLRYYLSQRKDSKMFYAKQLSNITIDGIRRCIKSFFTFLFSEKLIDSNPTNALTQIKYDKVIKKSFSDIELEKIKRACDNKRDRALVEFLYSTGCRVSEIVKLNRDNINFDNLSVVVHGKGNKERYVYLSNVCALYLKEYLESRTDSFIALFVGRQTDRLSKSGIEYILHKLGERANVSQVYPHRYRRTLATNLLNRGTQIQDVAIILGHEDLKTTQIYCCIDMCNVQNLHRRYVS